jgi:YidC/Oxa1 family membrane protein insertase
MKKPEDQNNLFLAVILSMAVLFLWHYFIAAPHQRELERVAQQEKQVAAEQAAKSAAPAAPAAPGQIVGPATGPGAPQATAPQSAATSPQGVVATTRADALGRAPRLPIDTPALHGSISLKGGLIDDLTLKRYHETIDKQSPNVVLFSPLDAPMAYFAEYGWQAANPQDVPNGDTLWTAAATGPLSPANPAILTWDNGRGLVFTRKISVDDNYLFNVADSVENKTGSAVTLTPYARLYRIGTPHIEGFIIQHEGLIGVPGDKLTEITYADAVKEGGESFTDRKSGWVGITDKYWAASLVPPQQTAYNASMKGRPANAGGRDLYWVDYALPAVTTAPGQTSTVEGHLYAGAKEVKVIEGYEERLKIANFNLMVDWGIFGFLTKPLYHLLDWLYGILGNFGLAILAVTVLVKLAFFPLANKSYESMAKMKKLQPQMEALRERFKDDKARQQQELMALYKNEKINPLAGCLPILLQIPVFFALYKVLFVSIDMRHAPFYGWIHDLSAKDPTSLFNLFGLLPYAVPDFLHVGAWPLIMGITMWLQMQLNPPQPDPVQQAVFSWMPVLFTFLLAAFPAGLVIYWAWNNILSLAQQYYILKKQGAEIHLFQNIKRTIGKLGGVLGMGRAPRA